MGILDLFRKIKKDIEREQERNKQEGEEQVIKIKDIKPVLEEKKQEYYSKQGDLIKAIKENLDNTLIKLKEKYKSLESINISNKRETERLKDLVNENLAEYSNYLSNLITLLDSFDYKNKDLEQVILELNKILGEFQKRSGPSYERATILIGKELGDIRDTLNMFFRKISAIEKQSASLISTKHIVNDIEKKLQEISKFDKEIEEFSEEIKKIEKKAEELEKNKKETEEEILGKKESEDYKKEQILKSEAKEKRDNLEKDLMKIRSQIDFKALEKIYHSSEKKMSLLKSYQKDFRQIIEKPESDETRIGFLNILAEKDSNQEEAIEKEIRDIRKEFENITELLSKQDSLKSFHNKINHISNELLAINSEKEKSFRRIATIKKSIDSVNEDILSNLEKLGLAVEG